MHQWRAQYGGGSLNGGYARYNHYLDVGVRWGSDALLSFREFQGESRHAVYAGVAAGNEGDRFAGSGDVERLGAAFHLAHHAGGDHLLVRQERLDELEVSLVADNHVSQFDHLAGLEGHVVQPAGTYSYYVKLGH